MKDAAVWISEDDLGSLSLEILDYVDRISEIFDKLNACIDKLPNHYQGEPCREFMNKYQELSTYFPIIKGNLTTYSDDLISLINKMRDNDKYLTTLFQEFTDDTTRKTKSMTN